MRRNYAINLALSAALFMGETLSEVLFLSRYGVAALPLGMIGTAVLGVVVTAIYTRALVRQPSGQLLVIIIAVVAALNLLIWGALLAGASWAALALFLSFRPARDLLQTQIWNYFADQYDTQEAKIRFPVIGAAGRIGALVGAGALPLLLNTVGVSGTILAWVSWFCVGLAALLAGRLRSGIPHPTSPPQTNVDTQSLLRIPLARSLTVASALSVLLVLLLTYQNSSVLVIAFPDERQLGTIYAVIAIVANLVGWLFQTFGLPRVIRMLGVSRTNLIYPIAALGVSLWVGLTASVSAAIAGQVVRTALRQILQVPVEDLLMNALVPALRSRMRAIVRGAVAPLGATIGCLLILGLQTVGWGTQVIPWLSALVSAATLVTALWVRHAYSDATMLLAREQNPIAQRLAFAGFGSADPETIRLLHARLTAASTIEDQIFIGHILIELDRVVAEKLLVAHIAHSPPEAQAALLSLLNEHKLAGEPLLGLAPRLLRAPQPEVRRAILDALGGVRALTGSLYRTMLDDPDPLVQISAARLLLRSHPDDARARLTSLAQGGSAEVRVMVMEAIGGYGPDLLVGGLADTVPQVRIAATDAARKLPNLANIPTLTAALGDALNDAVEPVRRAAASALGHAGPNQANILVSALADRSPTVRTLASDSLIQLGSAALPALQACLATETSFDQREATLVTLIRLHPKNHIPELTAFEESILEQTVNLLQLRQTLGKLTGPAGTLLLDDLAEEESGSLDRLNRLLAATNGADLVRSIWQGLRAPDRNQRAQAREALENIRSPWYARLLATMLQPDRLTERILAIAAQRWSPQQLTSQQAWAQVGAGSAWRRDLVAATLAERQASMRVGKRGGAVLSVVEKAIFLRAVPVFQAMAPGQLQILAGAGEELEYPKGSAIFSVGDPADRLFVIVSGRVGIEETRARGNVVRVATMEAKDPFGELAVFDAPAHTTSAIAIDDCYLLAIRREVLLDLIGQYPDLALTIIKFLSGRLREASSTIAEKTRARPRQIVDLFDKME